MCAATRSRARRSSITGTPITRQLLTKKNPLDRLVGASYLSAATTAAGGNNSSLRLPAGHRHPWPRERIRFFAGAAAGSLRPSRGGKEKPNKFEANWEFKYELLLQYKKDKGDCLVPISYTVNGVALGNWINAQRKEYQRLKKGKSSRIMQNHINKLEAAGFDWDPRKTQWNLRYELLRQYKKDKGDCLVPKSFAVDGVALGKWVNTQRVQYHKFQKDEQSGKITQDRINKLDAVGFDWDPRETQWNLRYELLRQYKKDKGDCQVPKSFAVDGVALGRWVNTQRVQYHKFQNDEQSAKITQDRINKLDAVGFDWGPIKTQWNSNYELLRQYFNDNGDSLVPQHYTVDGVALGLWVRNQRVQYKKFQNNEQSATITQDHINKLDAVGFDWSPIKTQWNSNYELLQQYYNDKGDSRVPQHYTVDGVDLGVWANAQRVQYQKLKEGKLSSMTEDRINKLQALDFIWNLNGTYWNSNYELLRQYKKDKGDCLVPQKYTVNGVALGVWVGTQRTEYWLFQKGKHSHMTEERINKLDAIDFDWSPGESKWNLRYELLQKYKKDKGNCRVPKTYAVDGVALGNWISSQRHEYWKLQGGKPSAMTKERINKLEAVGFDWSPRKAAE